MGQLTLNPAELTVVSSSLEIMKHPRILQDLLMAVARLAGVPQPASKQEEKTDKEKSDKEKSDTEKEKSDKEKNDKDKSDKKKKLQIEEPSDEPKKKKEEQP